MAASYPVHFEVTRAGRFTRMQLFVRLAAILGVGLAGLSLGTVFWAAYLLLPVYAASRIASLGTANDYARQDGPRVMRALHWYAAVSAWLGLVAEALPAHGPDETVTLSLDPTPVRSSPVAALLRVLTGLLSALVLGILSFFGFFAWLWAALSVVLHESVGVGAFSYLLGVQRWTLRLLAYQACLVDEYPPFSFSDGPGHAPRDEQRIVTV